MKNIVVLLTYDNYDTDLLATPADTQQQQLLLLLLLSLPCLLLLVYLSIITSTLGCM